MNKQGSWTRWESVRERALTWQDIWSMEGHRIKASESAAAETRSKAVLAKASNWEMRVDLRKQLNFPEEITHTSLRPDIVLWSKVPWEERMEEAHECKLKKYQALIFESQQNGWKAWNLPVEVGCRGFAGQSLWRALGLLGIEGPARKWLVANITKQADMLGGMSGGRANLVTGVQPHLAQSLISLTQEDKYASGLTLRRTPDRALKNRTVRLKPDAYLSSFLNPRPPGRVSAPPRGARPTG
ncbi:hypothetical protein N1851_017138 [Merluccius polli]|uniref:Uncharacterized protein n=1 Tax=Merluccius polli TaxID=89951 RepID=A0AA47MQ95_MERPO|nr:hypothetical protein N1851_017138 [Merluccius polli]